MLAGHTAVGGVAGGEGGRGETAKASGKDPRAGVKGPHLWSGEGLRKQIHLKLLASANFFVYAIRYAVV